MVLSQAYLPPRTPWLLKFLHQIGELGEEVVRIVRAGAGFGVILHAEERQGFMAHAFVGLIVQVYVRDFHIFGRQRIRIYTEAVILRGDFDLLGEQILYRMIRAVVAKFQLEGFSAKREAAQLVAEA